MKPTSSRWLHVPVSRWRGFLFQNRETNGNRLTLGYEEKLLYLHYGCRKYFRVS